VSSEIFNIKRWRVGVGNGEWLVKLKSNQLRLWLSSVAYVLMKEMRRLGLAGTEMEQAQ
jgi:hypothetical protein